MAIFSLWMKMPWLEPTTSRFRGSDCVSWSYAAFPAASSVLQAIMSMSESSIYGIVALFRFLLLFLFLFVIVLD